MLAAPGHSIAQGTRHPLESVAGLRLHNVVAEPATLDGRRGLRVTLDSRTAQPDAEQLVVIEGLEFSSGVIEAEIAGTPASGSGQGARGFVGIAFRLQPDMKTYDAFYLRPTNGRAEDQERRNHATQYISHPDWTWNRMREETPSRYESYVDQPQPVLIVNDVKSGATAKGAIALWLGPGTVAHFRNLRVQ
jgi:hypothetical protein